MCGSHSSSRQASSSCSSSSSSSSSSSLGRQALSPERSLHAPRTAQLSPAGRRQKVSAALQTETAKQAAACSRADLWCGSCHLLHACTASVLTALLRSSHAYRDLGAWAVLSSCCPAGSGPAPDAQTGAQAYQGGQQTPLANYRPSEDQLEKLTKHVQRQAELGELLAWTGPLGSAAAKGGLSVATHQV